MFNIFQYDKINNTRIHQQNYIEKNEQVKKKHDKKNEVLSSQANIRRLEWAAKFLNSDVKNSKNHTVLQEGSIKLMNSSILQCRKSSSSDESEVGSNTSEMVKVFQKMDTRILHPYKDTTHALSPQVSKHDSAQTLKGSARSDKEKKKPFNPYSRSYKKNESAWEDMQVSYSSSPYENPFKHCNSERNVSLKNKFRLGVKNDLWNGLIKPRESIRTYQSNKNLKLLPDAKLYKKSLEHLISRRIS